MNYSPTTWQDEPSTATPVDANNLNKIEQGIVDAHELADGAAADVVKHADRTDAHGATTTAVAGRVVRRDAAGKAQVTTPVDSDADTAVATIGYVKGKVAEGGGGIGEELGPKVFPVWWTGTAWEYATLDAATAAGYDDGDTVQFIGNPDGAPPTWAPSGRSLWTQGG